METESTLLKNIKIAPFGINYIEDVSEIHFQVLDGWSMKGLISDLANSATRSYVAEYDGRALAFCSYLVTDDAELLFVCTHPSYRGQGIATKLLKETMRALPENVNNVVLEVRSRNRDAIKLYTKLGFKKLGVRKGFYTIPADDAEVMEYTKGGVKGLD